MAPTLVHLEGGPKAAGLLGHTDRASAERIFSLIDTGFQRLPMLISAVLMGDRLRTARKV